MSLGKTLKYEVYLAPAFHIVIVLSLICECPMSRGTHSCMLGSTMKSILYTCTQSGKIIAGLDGIPRIYTPQIDTSTLQRSVPWVLCKPWIYLWFSPRSAQWLILNTTLNIFLTVTVWTVGRFGLEPRPEVALKIEDRHICGWCPSLCCKGTMCSANGTPEIVIQSE